MKRMVDTNILIRARDASDPMHSACVEALLRLRSSEDVPCVCAQVMIEYWSVATRPRNVNGLELDPSEAAVDLRNLEAAFELLPEPPDMAARWRELAERCSVRGRQVHDTRLAALMLAHGVTSLITLNRPDFARYGGITCVSPEDV